MLVSDLKVAVKRYGFDDEDPLLTWINAAYHAIEEEYASWSFLHRMETLVGTANQSLFVPTGSVQRAIKFRDITDTLDQDLFYWDERKFDREIRNQNEEGNPEVYTIRGTNELQVWPVPNVARTYILRYIEALADLEDDGDEPKLPTKNHFLIAQGAAYIGLQAENEEDRAANAQAQFTTALARMVSSDMNNQTGQSDSAQDVMGYTE